MFSTHFSFVEDRKLNSLHETCFNIVLNIQYSIMLQEGRELLK